jgi:predicted aminopeptidase
VAAPPYSLTLKSWCFPVAGCVGYRGYYSEDAAKAEAEAQRALDLEVAVYPVPAYSTLGWMNWAGGDPLLSTFIGYPEGELARIVFHELAHQVLYVPGDTVFNESYATAVERIGGGMWLQREAGETARREYAQFDGQRQEFRALALNTRRALTQVYESPEAKAKDWPAVEAMKKAAMADFRARYAELKKGWPGPRQGAYDGWVARANNAAFGAQGAYDDLVPAFEALFAHEGRDWPRFYTEVTAHRRAADHGRTPECLAGRHGHPANPFQRQQQRRSRCLTSISREITRWALPAPAKSRANGCSRSKRTTAWSAPTPKARPAMSRSSAAPASTARSK